MNGIEMLEVVELIESACPSGQIKLRKVAGRWIVFVPGYPTKSYGESVIQSLSQAEEYVALVKVREDGGGS